MKTKVATSQGRINQREPFTDPYISMMLKWKDNPYLASLSDATASRVVALGKIHIKCNIDRALGVVAIDLPAGEIQSRGEASRRGIN